MEFSILKSNYTYLSIDKKEREPQKYFMVLASCTEMEKEKGLFSSTFTDSFPFLHFFHQHCFQ